MANEVKLPRLGQGMEAGTVNKWLKSEGDTVAKGEPLFEVDTDKVTQEVESDFAGVLLKIVLQEGEAPVGQTIAYIGEAGEEVKAQPAEPADAGSASEVAPPVVAPAPTTSASAPAEVQSNGGRIKASPLARRIARERGIDLRSLRGTGPEGRIVAEDVERGEITAPAPAAVPTGEIESVPLTNIRKTIARRLTAAWEAPVFQLTVSADMTRANELVAAARELNPDVRVTVTDLLAKVCAHALMRHRDVNVQYTEDALLRFPTANVGIAVAAPQGLVVPVLRSVERLTLAELAVARGDVVGRARESKLTVAGPGGRHVDDLQPRHVRDRAVRRGAQSAAGGDPRGRCDTRHAGGSRRRGRGAADHEHDADSRSPGRRRCRGRGLPAHGQAVRGRARAGVVIRHGSFADVPFMRSMLAHAYAWRVNALDAEIPLTRYVDNWGRAGDLSLVAHETGNRVGAAWFRLFAADEPGYGFVDEQTPELSISVVPSRRRHGVGQELLDALLEKAKAAGHAAVSLSVEQDSPSSPFYERNGFTPAGEQDGGLVMKRAL